MNNDRLNPAVAACIALVPLMWSLPCMARTGAADPPYDPYAAVQVESDSNLFATSNGFPVIDPEGVGRYSDTVKTYRGGINLDYLFGLQQFYGTFEGRRLEYDRFTDLDHSEYLAKFGLVWQLTRRFDGTAEYRREKKIIAFAQSDLTALEVQTDQNVSGTFNITVTPDWRVETRADLHTLEYPIAESPSFMLHETVEGVGLKYLGVANLAYGIEGIHTDGTYDGVPGFAGYKQNTVQLAAKYTITSITRLRASLGYTERTIEGLSSNVGGVTGQLAYDRQLTGKTSVTVEVQRSVNSYYTAVGSEVDTSGTLAVNWQATPKIALALNYQLVHSNFEGDALESNLTTGRIDKASNAGMEIKYRPLRLLLVRPYLRRQVRESNLAEFSYNDTELGVEVIVGRDAPVR